MVKCQRCKIEEATGKGIYCDKCRDFASRLMKESYRGCRKK